MAETLTLIVPADARYRGLGSEVAAKFAEIVGGSAADAEAVSAMLTKALEQIAAGAPEGGHIDMTLHANSSGVELTVRFGERSSTIRQPVPVRKP
jgi:hypothetical protein